MLRNEGKLPQMQWPGHFMNGLGQRTRQWAGRHIEWPGAKERIPKKMRNKKFRAFVNCNCKIPMNLQLFAEGGNDPGAADPPAGGNPDPVPAGGGSAAGRGHA